MWTRNANQYPECMQPGPADCPVGVICAEEMLPSEFASLSRDVCVGEDWAHSTMFPDMSVGPSVRSDDDISEMEL